MRNETESSQSRRLIEAEYKYGLLLTKYNSKLADYDQLKADSEVVADLAESRLAENLRLKAENERLKKIQSRQDKVAEHFKQFWKEIVDEPFTEWLNDDATHWICDEDAAFQAWQYLHQNKIWTMKEQTQLAIDERDTLRKQLSEATELVKRLTDYHPTRSKDMGYALNWLKAMKGA